MLIECRVRLAVVAAAAAAVRCGSNSSIRAVSAPVSRKTSNQVGGPRRDIQQQQEEEEEKEEDRSLEGLVSLAKQEMEEEAVLKKVRLTWKL